MSFINTEKNKPDKMVLHLRSKYLGKDYEEVVLDSSKFSELTATQEELYFEKIDPFMRISSAWFLYKGNKYAGCIWIDGESYRYSFKPLTNSSDPDESYRMEDMQFMWNGEKTPDPSNNVNHPSHYNQGGMEVWNVIKAFTSDLSGAEAFYAGNVIKYVLRWNHKNGTEDLEKAKVYIDKLIESRKGEDK